MGATISLGNAQLVGTNGSIEFVVKCLIATLARRYGEDDPVTLFFKSQRAGFFPGIWIDVGELLSDSDQHRRFVAAFKESFAAIQADQTWSESGRTWVNTKVPEFISEIDNEL